MKIYVVMIDMYSDKAFISKEKAQKYRDEKNKLLKEEILEDLEDLKKYYTNEEVEAIMKNEVHDEYYIEEIELEDAETSF